MRKKTTKKKTNLDSITKRTEKSTWVKKIKKIHETISEEWKQYYEQINKNELMQQIWKDQLIKKSLAAERDGFTFTNVVITHPKPVFSMEKTCAVLLEKNIPVPYKTLIIKDLNIPEMVKQYEEWEIEPPMTVKEKVIEDLDKVENLLKIHKLKPQFTQKPANCRRPSKPKGLKR